MYRKKRVRFEIKTSPRVVGLFGGALRYNKLKYLTCAPTHAAIYLMLWANFFDTIVLSSGIYFRSDPRSVRS